MKKSLKRPTQLERHRDNLLRLRAALTSNVSYLEDNALKPINSDGSAYASSGSSGGDHNAEMGTDSYDQDRMLRMAEDGEIELQEIDAAIQRIRDGSYGLCECCGKKIPQARLRALPYARLCLKCREEHERSLPQYT